MNPLNAITACGRAIPPCPNPPCNILQSPLNYCPRCVVLNTASFINKRLDEATSITLEILKTNDNTKYRKAISLFYEILNENYSNHDENENYLLSLNYMKLQESLGNAFSSKQITCKENRISLCSEILMILEIEKKLIDIADQEGNYYRKFLYTLDKAQTYRIACRLDLCLNVLYDVLSWAQTDDIEEVKNLICAVELEKDVLAGIIDMGSISDAMTQCNQTYVFRTTDPSSENPLSINDQETTISISPNPVLDIANLRTNIENAHITLFDGLGRVIVDEKINYDSDIDMASLPVGLYTLKIRNLKTSEYWIEKLIVQ